MLKLVGAVLIMSAATLYGFQRASRYGKRPVQIRQLIHALQLLETEIVYGYTPLPTALTRIAAQTPAPLERLFRKTAELMREPGAVTADCWEQAVKETWSDTAMEKAEREIAQRLGANLGLTDRQDQVKHIRLASSQLRSEEETAREDQRRYEKMWRTLGVLMGALVVILMY
ncbi:stage III sporulation protein SpoIIIAB [Paenibacillus turpanensis]|uniref:stage III sporulation protein SpoIIIAB n=1 Tax=Paenibacillus turpanensis TaxID=2689078 RepID=UPI00140B9EB2|nr:stage III sporulation protein SpoIIIAB [Paenibacillus turpanensis]